MLRDLPRSAGWCRGLPAPVLRRVRAPREYDPTLPGRRTQVSYPNTSCCPRTSPSSAGFATRTTVCRYILGPEARLLARPARPLSRPTLAAPNHDSPRTLHRRRTSQLPDGTYTQKYKAWHVTAPEIPPNAMQELPSGHVEIPQMNSPVGTQPQKVSSSHHGMGCLKVQQPKRWPARHR